MLASTKTLLENARAGGYAIGAFNVYNLEGVRAVVTAAEAESSPAMLQLHPAALKFGGAPLIALSLAAARDSTVPIGVHLDHSSSVSDISAALAAGVRSIMADGSQLDYAGNLKFTRGMTTLAHASEGFVEAELGRLSGTEDGLSIPEYQARLTDPRQASEFVGATGIDALAVCIGNAHGPYRGEPNLDFDRLAALRTQVDVPLVLHGASGLPEVLVRRAIGLGVCKFNVNTELREAYMRALVAAGAVECPPDMLDWMQSAVHAMYEVVTRKLVLFGSNGRLERTV